LPGQSIRDVVSVRSYVDPETGILAGNVVQASTKPSDLACCGYTTQGFVYSLTASQIEEVLGRKDFARSAIADSPTDLPLDVAHFSPHVVRKMYTFF
jgi:hypothetical protein